MPIGLSTLHERMEISDDLRCLFTAQLTDEDDSYVFEVPKQEVTAGTIAPGTSYRVGLVPIENTSGRNQAADEQHRVQHHEKEHPEPPVAEGEVRTVQIEDTGEQGDGIARVDQGYVIIVPGTDPGDEPTIEINTVRDTVAFGEEIEEGPAQ